MICIRNLTKIYAGGRIEVNEVTINLDPGVHGLLGPNGAGKTTLMRILATMLPPTSGEVTVFDLDLRRNQEEIREILGYLPQQFGLYPELTAGQLLDYLALLSGIVSARERGKRIEELLRSVNLWEVRGEKVDHFSGGMKQRLGIAQMLLNDPKALIVDEPTAGLDPEERISFRNLLNDLLDRNRDRVIIISTHIAEDLVHIAQNVAVLHHGRLIY